jgi:pimeloyl-ACP methyl ester carboxylesterase
MAPILLEMSAPTLVLLPGLDGTGDFFAPLLDALSPSVPTQVVRYPLTGASDYPTCEAIARAALPTDRPFVLLGESFSGPIAIAIAATAPPGLIGLVLSATFVANPRPHLGVLRPLLPFLPFRSDPLSLALSRFRVLGRWATPYLRALHRDILKRLPSETIAPVCARSWIATSARSCDRFACRCSVLRPNTIDWFPAARRA